MLLQSRIVFEKMLLQSQIVSVKKFVAKKDKTCVTITDYIYENPQSIKMFM